MIALKKVMILSVNNSGNPKYTNLILEMRLELGLGLRLALVLGLDLRLYNPNLVSKNKFRYLGCLDLLKMELLLDYL